MNRGKQFEHKFSEDVKKTFKDCVLIRLPDQLSGYKYSSTNICDFLLYKYPAFYFIECKSIDGNTFPFVNLSQYEKLLTKVGIPGVRAGVIIWFKDHDKVIYIPVKTIQQMKKDNKKSVNIKKDLNLYRIFEIPSVKKRVFLECNYTLLSTLEDGD